MDEFVDLFHPHAHHLDLRAYPENQALWAIYNCLHLNAEEYAPRGHKVREIENFSFLIEPTVRFANFPQRKYNIDYLRREFQWYLNGDPSDDRITKWAKIWGDVRNPDGWASNYGAYLFRDGQLRRCFDSLSRDTDTRRASVVILAAWHLLDPTAPDVPCTYSLNFRRRGGRLNMSVHMRSQDAIFGLGNDLPTFSFIHEMMATALDLEMGYYHQCVDSFHVYERHFPMLDAIVANGKYSHENIYIPKMTPTEAKNMIGGYPHTGAFTSWLHEVEL